MSFIDEIKAQMRVILTLFDEFKDDYCNTPHNFIWGYNNIVIKKKKKLLGHRYIFLLVIAAR